MMGPRSTKGCHTCRIRKKKCDERHPFCFSCTSRGITCYGYGLKPSGMLGEENAAQMTKNIRKVAEMNYRERRKRLSKSKSQVRLGEGTVSSLENDKQVVPCAQLITWDSAAYSSENDASSVFPTGTQELSISCTKNGKRSSFSSTSYARRFSSPPSSTKNLFWDGGLSAWHSPSDAQESSFLAHFLNIVIPLQFGFLHSSSSYEREYNAIFSLVVRSKAVLYTCLSLSICHGDVMRAGVNTTNSSGTMSQYLARMHLLGLKGTQEMISSLEKLKGAELLIAGMEILWCMHQLISVEIFRDIEGCWELHHAAARTLFQMLHRKNIIKPYFYPSFTSSPEKSTHEDDLITLATRNQPIYDRDFTSSENAMVSFILAYYIRIDIFCQVGDLCPPLCHSTSVDYLDLLDLQPSPSDPSQLQPALLDLQPHMGCENWVMVSLLHISSLRAWKRDVIANNRLSIFELSWRASILLQKLESGITTLLTDRKNLTPSGSGLENDISLVTEIFARAAITYLHVVVTGPKPYVDEIRESVASTMSILEKMPSRLLIRVSWPYLVTGCMAVGEEQRICREILDRPFKKGQNTGTAWKAMEVMEECWKVTNGDDNRNMSIEGFGWVEAMTALGKRILFC